MRLCLTICAVLVSACGRDEPPAIVPVEVNIPADLLVPCAGWARGAPQTEGEWAAAAAAELTGRRCANAKLGAVADIVGPR